MAISFLNKEKLNFIGRDYITGNKQNPIEKFLSLSSVDVHLPELLKEINKRNIIEPIKGYGDAYALEQHYTNHGGIWNDVETNTLYIGVLYSHYYHGYFTNYFIPVEALDIVDMFEVETEVKEIVDKKILEFQDALIMLQS